MGWREARRDVGDHRQQFGRFDGLGDVALKTSQQGARAVLSPGVRGQSDGGRAAASLRGQGAEGRDEAVAVLLRHSDIAHHDVEGPGPEKVQRVGGGAGNIDDRAAVEQHGRQQLTGILLVVENEDAQSRDSGRAFESAYATVAGSSGDRRRPRDGLERAHRNAHHEPRSLPLAFAVRLDRATVQLDQMFHDSKAQPQAAMHTGDGCISLPEPLEDVREKIWRDTFAGILDGDVDVRILALQPHMHPPALRCELHCVGEQVPANLL